jgi:hypothetical protein
VRNYRPKLVLLCFALFLLSISDIAVSQQPPDNVAGNWTIHSKDENGKTATKYIQLKQEGNNLMGHFKGPNQSGGLEGTVDVHHIMFRTKTRNVLTFRGQIEGNTMKGTFGIHGVHGEWAAVRAD